MHLSTRQAWDKKLIRYLAEQMLDEPVDSLKKLVGGGCHNYEINHHIIMKLPMTPFIWEMWLRQASLAPILQQHLKIQIPQIRVTPLQMPDKTYIMGIRYDKIMGHTIPCRVFQALKRKEKIKILEQVCDTMIDLHAVQPDRFTAYVPRYDDTHSPFQCDMTHKRKILHGFILRQLNKDNASGQKDVLCHADLHSENLCISGQKLVGVLDFDLMVRGSAESEFRPNLYTDSDMSLWAQIYQYRSGKTLNVDKIRQMRFVWKGLRTMMRAYNILNPLRLCSRIGNGWERRQLEAVWNRTR